MYRIRIFKNGYFYENMKLLIKVLDYCQEFDIIKVLDYCYENLKLLKFGMVFFFKENDKFCK